MEKGNAKIKSVKSKIDKFAKTPGASLDWMSQSIGIQGL
jgi:hypothetical protein